MMHNFDRDIDNLMIGVLYPIHMICDILTSCCTMPPDVVCIIVHIAPSEDVAVAILGFVSLISRSMSSAVILY